MKKIIKEYILDSFAYLNAGNGYRGELRRFCSIEAEAVPGMWIPV